MAKGLGIVAIKALVGQILSDDIVDAAERVQLHKLSPKDAKLAFDEFMSRPPRSRHRRAFDRARRADPTLFHLHLVAVLFLILQTTLTQ